MARKHALSDESPEGLVLRESIAARDATWEDALVLLVHRLSRTPRSLSADRYMPNPAWETLHRKFHRGLLARCPSRWLRGFCDTLADDAVRLLGGHYMRTSQTVATQAREMGHEA